MGAEGAGRLGAGGGNGRSGLGTGIGAGGKRPPDYRGQADAEGRWPVPVRAPCALLRLTQLMKADAFVVPGHRVAWIELQCLLASFQRSVYWSC